MKIEYIWIQDYESLHEREFNFGLSNKFEYNKKENLISHVEHEEKYLDFYNINKNTSNNIQDIVAIVGANGSGKTTLLKLITDIIRLDKHSSLSDFIMVFSERGKDFKIYTNIDNLAISECSYCNNLEYTIIDNDCEDIYSDTLTRLDLIYYSNAFDNSATIENGFSYENIFDISTINMIKCDKVNGKSLDSLKNHIQAEYKRQIKFVTSHQKSEKHLEFGIPRQIYIDTSGIETRMNMIISSVIDTEGDTHWNRVDDNESNNRETIGEALKSIQNKFEGSIKNNMFKYKGIDYIKLRMLYLYLVKSVESYIKDLDFTRTDLREVFEFTYFAEILNQDDIIASCSRYENKYGEFLSEFSPKSILSDIEGIDYILQSIEIDYINSTLICNIDKSMHILKETNYERYIQLKESEEEEVAYIKYTVEELYKIVCLQGVYEGMIEIFWPLSTGEYSLFSLYSRLYNLYISIKLKRQKYSNDEEQNIILLIDEGENSLHPKWQQQYIESIINLIDDIFNNVNVQVILTTHSPILLSDMPRDNVIYLNKDNEHTTNLKTFGANIYDLYNNSFFLNNSIKTGVIGTFADHKIKQALEELNDIEDKLKENNIEDELRKKLENTKMIVDLIGDEISKGILMRRYIELEERITNPVERKITNKIKKFYKDLNPDEKKELIKFILDEEL